MSSNLQTPMSLLSSLPPRMVFPQIDHVVALLSPLWRNSFTVLPSTSTPPLLSLAAANVSEGCVSREQDTMVWAKRRPERRSRRTIVEAGESAKVSRRLTLDRHGEGDRPRRPDGHGAVIGRNSERTWKCGNVQPVDSLAIGDLHGGSLTTSCGRRHPR